VFPAFREKGPAMNEYEKSAENEPNAREQMRGPFSYDSTEDGLGAEDSIVDVHVSGRARWVPIFEASLVHDGRQGRPRVTIDFVEVGLNNDPFDLEVKALLSQVAVAEWLALWFEFRAGRR
jgi:hypothetical protein